MSKLENEDQSFGHTENNTSRKILFHRRKNCPFSGKNGSKISYLDTRMLSRYVSERGKMTPSRITAVSAKKQRELSRAIKRARFLALMPYVNK
jgi:small subunit ribosomal protein S18